MVERDPGRNGGFAARFRVRPGWTGLAQVLSRDPAGGTTGLQYDLYYLDNMTPLLDLRSLGRALSGVMGRHEVPGVPTGEKTQVETVGADR